MKRLVFAALAAVIGALALVAWRAGEAPQAAAERGPAPRQAAAGAPVAPPAQAAASPAASAASATEGGDGLRRVPVPPVDSRSPAWLSMSRARQSGDERAPPTLPGAPAAHPEAGVLSDPAAYASYELAQKQRLAAAYVQAAAPELARLQADLERGREAGIPAEELAKVAEKIRRIEEQRQAAGAMLPDRKEQ